MCNKFIWSYKTQRINFNTLKWPWERDRLNYPDFNGYYEAI